MQMISLFVLIALDNIYCMWDAFPIMESVKQFYIEGIVQNFKTTTVKPLRIL